MKKFFYLASCSTCARIMQEIGIENSAVELREIKSAPITEKEMDEMIQLAGTAEALFSRVALKYRALGLNEKKLTEKDYRKYILEEYTFLKRPVLVLGKKIFIGNSKGNVEEMRKVLAR
jgi:arsenate reductase